MWLLDEHGLMMRWTVSSVTTDGWTGLRWHRPSSAAASRANKPTGVEIRRAGVKEIRRRLYACVFNFPGQLAINISRERLRHGGGKLTPHDCSRKIAFWHRRDLPNRRPAQRGVK